jgi:hypothetical protein
VKWKWRFPCARPILLGKSGSVRHKDGTWLTLCRRLLWKLATFCGKHPDEVASSAANVIPVPERHTVPCVECEAFLPAQGNSHYSFDLVTSVRFSEAMYDTYRLMVGENVFYRH